jgi:hypothetical protein
MEHLTRTLLIMARGRDWVILGGTGLLLEGLALWVAERGNLKEGFVPFLSGYLAMSIVYLLAVYYVLNHCQEQRALIAFVLTMGVALRATFLLSSPTLSDDIYRYLWDGRMQIHGVNPYRFSPNAPELSSLHDVSYERLNNPELPTIYPPLAQIVFAFAAALSEKVIGMKTVFVLADLAVLTILLRLLVAVGANPMRSLIYAWSPLASVEIAGNGHSDVLAILCLLAAHRAIIHKKGTLSICFLACSAAAKLLPLALAPPFLRAVRPRVWLALPAMLLAFSLPYWGAGERAFQGLAAYTFRWRSNDSLFHLLFLLSGSLDYAKAAAAALFGGGVAWLTVRRIEPLRAVYLALGGFLLLSPTVHPWYVLWIVPYLCFFPSPAWLLLSATVALAYHAPALSAPGATWQEAPLFKLLEYAPVFALAGISRLRLSRSGGAGARATAVL